MNRKTLSVIIVVVAGLCAFFLMFRGGEEAHPAIAEQQGPIGLPNRAAAR